MYDKEVYHFLVLHFPIALFITAYIFDTLYIVLKKDEFKTYIIWTIGMAIIWSIISIITGFITAFEMEYLDTISDFVNKKHSRIMILATLLYIPILYFKHRQLNQKILFLLHTIATFLIIYGAHLGAKWASRI
tara:strand:+ start:410 stop:808 length:399 start_codon:yes stop_codon:yes gene_type:complete